MELPEAADDVVFQEAVLYDHQRGLQINGVSTPSSGRKMSQRLIAKWIDSTHLLRNPTFQQQIKRLKAEEGSVRL